MATVANSNLHILPKDTKDLKDAFIVLVKTEWNAAIVDELESGCIKKLQEYNIKYITVVVPGAVEIPFAINQYWKQKSDSDKPTAFVALACIVRGDTPHFDYVCQLVTTGITQLNLNLPVPVIFGVLTVDNEQQAKERIGGAHGHKGEEAAITALKMVLLNRQMSKR